MPSRRSGSRGKEGVLVVFFKFTQNILKYSLNGDQIKGEDLTPKCTSNLFLFSRLVQFILNTFFFLSLLNLLPISAYERIVTNADEWLASEQWCHVQQPRKPWIKSEYNNKLFIFGSLLNSKLDTVSNFSGSSVYVSESVGANKG